MAKAIQSFYFMTSAINTFVKNTSTSNNVLMCVRRVAFDNDGHKCGSVLGSLVSHAISELDDYASRC